MQKPLSDLKMVLSYRHILPLLLVPFLEMQRSGIENSNGFGYEAWRQKSYSTASRYILQDAAGYHHKGTFTLYRPA